MRTEKVAPEGGWGYVVAIGMIIPLAIFMGNISAFGLLFNDFLAQSGSGTSAVTVIIGVYSCSASFAALFGSSLFKQFSIRTVGLWSSFAYTLGGVACIFVTSVSHLIICFGILQGIGNGVMCCVAYSTFNQYFDKRRNFMMSLAQALKGIIIMVYPMLVHLLKEKYGFRGAAAVLAAINSHSIFGMLTMQPIEWHYKHVEIPVEENVSLVKSNDDGFELKALDVILEDATELNGHSDAEDKTQSNDQVKCQNNRDGCDPFRQRIASNMSISDFGGDVAVTMRKSGKWGKVVDFLDLALLKDFVFVNITLGISFSIFADTFCYIVLPIYLLGLGFSEVNTARILSVAAAADLGSRIFLALLSLWIHVKARHVYLAGVIATIITRFVLLNTSTLAGMMMTVSTMSIFRTWLHVPITLVYAEHLKSERFPAGYGLYVFIQGNLAFLLGPLFGWVKDVTHSYETYFHSLTFTLCLCAIPWLIEMTCFRFSTRKTQTEEKDVNNV